MEKFYVIDNGYLSTG